MRSCLLALAVLVLVTAGSRRADVAPFPSWRPAANGTIICAVNECATSGSGDEVILDVPHGASRRSSRGLANRSAR